MIQKKMTECHDLPVLAYRQCIQKRRNELIAGVDVRRIGFILKAITDGLNLIHCDLETLIHLANDDLPCDFDWSTAIIKKIIKKGLKRDYK